MGWWRRWLDYARWGLGVEGLPTTAMALGGKYAFDDDQPVATYVYQDDTIPRPYYDTSRSFGGGKTWTGHLPVRRVGSLLDGLTRLPAVDRHFPVNPTHEFK